MVVNQRIVAGLVLVAISCSALQVAAGPVTHRTVVLSGDPAPGTAGGEQFSAFDLVCIDNSGRTAFRGTVSGMGVDATNDLGLWSEGTGVPALVAREGSEPPDTAPDVAFDFFATLVLNDAGQTAFLAGLVGPTVDNTNGIGIWSEGSGTLALLARTGSQAPDTSAGTVFSFFDSQATLLNAAGRTVIRGSLTGGAGMNGRGIWSEGAGSLALLAREGVQAPGTPSGVTFLFLLNAPVINASGKTTFQGFLTGAGVDGTNNSGLWSEGSGTLGLVARAGDPAPGTAIGVDFLSVLNKPIGLNDAGQTVFPATLTGAGVDATNDKGIWSEGSGTVDLVARTGDVAPGTSPDTFFADLGTPVINGAGRATFHALLTGVSVDATNDEGIWSEGHGLLNMVARSGMGAPGTPVGVDFKSFGDPVLNGWGQTAFRAELVGAGVTASNDFGLWAEDPSGALTLVAREGDPLQVDPGDIRTIQSLSMVLGSGGQDGRPRSFSDSGQLAYAATFADLSSGIFITTICVAGDLSGDAMADAADVGPFVGVLLNPTIAAAAGHCSADMNGDGSINSLDIQPFVNEILP